MRKIEGPGDVIQKARLPLEMEENIGKGGRVREQPTKGGRTTSSNVYAGGNQVADGSSFFPQVGYRPRRAPGEVPHHSQNGPDKKKGSERRFPLANRVPAAVIDLATQENQGGESAKD